MEPSIEKGRRDKEVKEIKEFKDGMFVVFHYDGHASKTIKKVPATLREVKYRLNEKEIAVAREITGIRGEILLREIFYTMTIGEFIEIEQRKFKGMDPVIISRACKKAAENLPAFPN